MAKVEVSQFEGSLLGVLIGDCFGSPFANEMRYTFSHEKIQTYFENTLNAKDEETITYTDDTSMTKALAQSLINTEVFDAADLAKRFTENYYSETRARHYGNHVRKVFYTLKSTEYEDIFKPASEQFNGHGSLGNGSGMRIAPVALNTINDTDLTRLTTMAVQASRVTHTNPKGIVGGIFQALAVRQGLLYGLKRKENKDSSINPIDILNDFEKDFEMLASGKIELASEIPSFQSGFADYTEKLKTIRKLLVEGNENWDIATIQSSLGVEVTAAESVPTAFFCFLTAFKPIPFLEADNQFHRTILLAVALGGDTDTIASMAGAIAGGYLGRCEIPETFIKTCEDFEEITELAKKLYEKTMPSA